MSGRLSAPKPGRFFGLLVFGFLCLAALAPPAAAQNAARGNPLNAVVGVRAQVPPSARTADTLGGEREGGGVVIGEDGLVLTIGYLIMEAVQTEIIDRDGSVVPADVVAYDYDTGFGLLRPLSKLDATPIELGDSTQLPEETKVLVAGPDGPSAAMVVSRREFAGYWEYLLPDAIFTAPPYRSFGGAALIGADGRLLGIGSLIVADAMEPGKTLPGNMFVPISALPPIMEDLLREGRSTKPARPWLGLYTQELRGHVLINRVAPDGPAAQAGVAANAIITQVGGRSVSSLAEFYRAVWALGDAGVEVPLTLLDSRLGTRQVTVTSGDRYDYLKLNPSY
ncbi:S1C family serine protease [Pelagibius marinus]|uniref:S1C family serine protease n=1 Tax=Pelagibius marinus TaxID=2762760 RepID=UPI00187271DB|nr:S1C family serine protease [Pelagibius marinus]